MRRVFAGKLVVAAAVLIAPSLSVAPLSAGAAARGRQATGTAYLTLLFGRAQWGPADNCKLVTGGLTLLEMAKAMKAMNPNLNGVGDVIMDRVGATHRTCYHSDELYPTWDDLTTLQDDYGWNWVSGGKKHTIDMTKLTVAEQRTESCGTLKTLESHGFTRGWGLFAYPDNLYDTQVQTQVVSTCFAYGRTYGKKLNEMGQMVAPWFQKTFSLRGGSCNDAALACYDASASPSQRYLDPAVLAAAMQPTADEWSVVQGYRFVTGADTTPSSGPSWDCTSTDWTAHWTSEDELYCWNDYVTALQSIPAGVVVTDPATVATAWGRVPTA